MIKPKHVYLFVCLVLSLLVAQCAPAVPSPIPTLPTSYPPPAGELTHTPEQPTPVGVTATLSPDLPYPAPGYGELTHTPERPISLKTPSMSAATATPRASPTLPDYQIDTSDWIWYRHDTLGYEFKYPPQLQMMEVEDAVILNHSIEYENCGDCDMSGYCDYHERLVDFNVSFEIVDNHFDHDWYDFAYNAGMLEGYCIYYGGDGCGYSLYHFPLEDDKTLVVTRAAIQALSGISLNWDLDEILQVPGVIPKEEAEEIFYHVLASFRFFED